MSRNGGKKQVDTDTAMHFSKYRCVIGRFLSKMKHYNEDENFCKQGAKGFKNLQKSLKLRNLKLEWSESVWS